MNFLVSLLLRNLFGRRYKRVIRPWPAGTGRHVTRKRAGSMITGNAYVIDADGVKVSGYNIRFAGLDAPEWYQPAKDQRGWFNHGRRVKSALIKKIGGKYVQVKVEGYDKYNRVIGTVICNGEDVGEWLVKNGHAIAAYGDQYQHLQREARQARRGMWSYDKNYDPRVWRHRQARRD